MRSGQKPKGWLCDQCGREQLVAAIHYLIYFTTEIASIEGKTLTNIKLADCCSSLCLHNYLTKPNDRFQAKVDKRIEGVK